MGVAYTVSRFIVAFFGFTTLLGILWFTEALSGVFVTAGVIAGLSGLAAAFISQRKLSNSAVGRALVVLCVLGICSEFILIANDFGASSGIEWHIVLVRFLYIAAFAVMAIRARKEPSAAK